MSADKTASKTTKKSTAKKATTKKSTSKKDPAKKVLKKKTSPYGVATEIMGANPDITKKDLVSRCKKRKIDVEAGSTAITTAYSNARTMARYFRASGLMKAAPEA